MAKKKLRLRRILAATDFSRAAELAVARAARLAGEHRARLILLHVVDLEGAGLVRASPRGLERRLRTEVERSLGRIAAGIRRDRRVRASVKIARGTAAAKIAAVARRPGADLIVVGAHGRHSLLDNVLGTTAQRVLRLAKAPVLIVRGAADASYREVLLPCDDSASSRAAVRFAAAALPHARCILANVANVPYEGFLTRGGANAEALTQYRMRAQEEARARLTALAAEAGITERFSIRVARGYVPRQIQRLAEELDHGLVAMGAYGHSALAATLLGSVSAHVAAEAPCDVLLVKA